MRFSLFLAILALPACSTVVAGVGETTTGAPISGQYIAAPSAGGVTVTISFLAANQTTCSGQIVRADAQLVSAFPVSCADGRTGTASFTSDFINARDTLIYRLNSGENGRVTFGATTSVS